MIYISHLSNIFLFSILTLILTGLGYRLIGLLKIEIKDKLLLGLVSFALGAGLISYFFYILGLADGLHPLAIFGIFLALIFFLTKDINKILRYLFAIIKPGLGEGRATTIKYLQQNKVRSFFILLLIITALLNLIGALGPEIELDAMRQHLSLPSRYLTSMSTQVISSDVILFSAAPRLTEMIDMMSLALGNQIVARIFHFAFGVFIALTAYLIGKRFFTKTIGFWAMFSIYLTYSIGWLSKTVNADLATAFFGLLAFLMLLIWFFERSTSSSSQKWLIATGVILGLSMASMTWSIALLPAFAILFLWIGLKPEMKDRVRPFAKHIGLFLGVAILIALPWYLDAYFATGNPFYPYGSISLSELDGNNGMLADWWSTSVLNTSFPDIIDYLLFKLSPFLLFLLLLPFIWKRISANATYVLGLSLLIVLFSFIIPFQFGVLLPGIALALIAAAAAVTEFASKNASKKIGALALMLVFAGTSMFYGYQDVKSFFPTVLGTSSSIDFLKEELLDKPNYYYDHDEWAKNNLQDDQLTLVNGVENLFYLNFKYREDSELDYSLEGMDLSAILDFFRENEITHLLLKDQDLKTYLLNHHSDITEEEFKSSAELAYEDAANQVLIYNLFPEEEKEEEAPEDEEGESEEPDQPQE